MCAILERLPNDIRVLIAKEIHRNNIKRLNIEYREDVRTRTRPIDGEFVKLMFHERKFNWRSLLYYSSGEHVHSYFYDGFTYTYIYNIYIDDIEVLPLRYKFSRKSGL